MTDLENQKSTNPKSRAGAREISSFEPKVAVLNSDFDDSPALVALEAKLLRRRRHEMPHTYRRPAYLQYIEYV